MAAPSKATAKPASSIVVPPEGLVFPTSAVIETTGGDHNLAALEPLKEEPDLHKGDWRGSPASPWLRSTPPLTGMSCR